MEFIEVCLTKQQWEMLISKVKDDIKLYYNDNYQGLDPATEFELISQMVKGCKDDRPAVIISYELNNILLSELCS